MQQNTRNHNRFEALEKLYLPRPVAAARNPLRGRKGWLETAVARAPARALTASRSTDFATLLPPPLYQRHRPTSPPPITRQPSTLYHCTLLPYTASAFYPAPLQGTRHDYKDDGDRQRPCPLRP